MQQKTMSLNEALECEATLNSVIKSLPITCRLRG